MFAVVMLVLNGFLGLALLLGGLRHHEQRYNPQSANSFLVMILPLTVLGLILPDFTHTTEGPLLSTFQMIFLSVMSVGIIAFSCLSRTAGIAVSSWSPGKRRKQRLRSWRPIPRVRRFTTR